MKTKTKTKTMTKTKKGGRKWSMKYKKSINCSHPKGFSQRQYCKYGRTKKIKTKKIRT
jgi:hypothetical protein